MELTVAVLAVAIAGFLVRLGYRCAKDEVVVAWIELDYDRAALEAEQQAFEQTKRVRAVFLDVRRAMQREAQRSFQQLEGER